MAGDEPKNQLTALPQWYKIKDAIKEVKRQQALPTQQQSEWYDKRGNRVYFTNVR